MPKNTQVLPEDLIKNLHDAKVKVSFDPTMAQAWSKMNPEAAKLDPDKRIAVIQGTLNKAMSEGLLSLGPNANANRFLFEVIATLGDETVRLGRDVNYRRISAKQVRNEFETLLKHKLRRAFEAYCEAQQPPFSGNTDGLVKDIANEFTKAFADARLVNPHSTVNITIRPR